MKDGAYTVETVIPFCKDVEDVADQSKPEHDVWGGIGVYSINFSKASSELLAASALRTGRLEIWDVNQRCFIKSIELFGEDTCIRELNFSPFNPS